ncbi:transmembrane channel-like protein 7 [Tubulanus polymorphus]|uniref:transmembrane channel-like protein 7 n=1 Tax=Tubulanus polymorphus TaxID=672921 RepID=UPI003DA28A6F
MMVKNKKAVTKRNAALHDRNAVTLGQITNQQDLLALLPSHGFGFDDDGELLQRGGNIQRAGATVRRRRTTKRRRASESIYATIRSASRQSTIDGGGESIEMETAFGADVEEQRDETDLVDDEVDEDEQWNQEQAVKDMATSLTIKRELRMQIQNAPMKKLKGVAGVKHRNRVKWQNFKRDAKDAMYKLKVWNSSFKAIEGGFGMGVGSFFRFLKWLFFLNIYISVIMIAVVLIPQLILKPHNFREAVRLSTGDNLTSISAVWNDSATASALTDYNTENISFVEQSVVCSKKYEDFINNKTQVSTTFDKVLDLLKGTGWLERTILFYGYYFNKTYIDQTIKQGHVTVYNMPLAYLLATGAYYLVSLLLLVIATGSGFKSMFIVEGDTYFKYANTVFCGWDYCMTDLQLAREKQAKLHREFTIDMEIERLQEERENRTFGKKLKVIITRILINMIVVAILGAAGYLIFWVNGKSLELLKEPKQKSEIVLLLIEYMPAGVIMILNFVIPMLFLSIAELEDYSPEAEIRITLLRTVFLRLASLAVLIASLYGQITGCNKECGTCPQLKCWETYVGQSFYKLVILDFAVQFLVTIASFIRYFVVSRLEDKSKLIKWLGKEEFDIPKNVLDIVYAQVLCWIGGFFCILIPAITVLKLFLLFYLKKVTVIYWCVSSTRTYKASKSHKFFLYILLISYILTLIPVGYSIGQIPPSQGCGAFRVYSSPNHTMFDTIENTVKTLPNVIGKPVQFLGSPHFYVPLIILMCLLMYYYYAVSAGRKRMIELLKEELVLEGKDKQFLLSRVKDVLFDGNSQP